MNDGFSNGSRFDRGCKSYFAYSDANNCVGFGCFFIHSWVAFFSGIKEKRMTRPDHADWPMSWRISTDRFYDAIELSQLRKSLKKRGIDPTLDQTLYLRKENFIIRAVKSAPDLYSLVDDQVFRGMIKVVHTKTLNCLHFPERKAGVLQEVLDDYLSA
jgi:hypothetical protein